MTRTAGKPAQVLLEDLPIKKTFPPRVTAASYQPTPSNRVRKTPGWKQNFGIRSHLFFTATNVPITSAGSTTPNGPFARVPIPTRA